MKVTNQNLVVVTGGTHQIHYPIWVDDDGVEYIPNGSGRALVKLSDQVSKQARRETVVRT